MTDEGSYKMMTRKVATTLQILLLLFLAPLAIAAPCPDSEQRNQLPMYGDQEKTPCMKQADEEFLEGIRKQGVSREEGAREVVKLGWKYWAKGDLSTAMSRFNQAWLLNPENGNIYHGFALIISNRGGSPDQVERFFRLAVSKPEVDAVAFVDYGRFCWTQEHLDKSLEQLNKALQVSPTARNARSNMAFVYYLKHDYASACKWAKKAKENGDKLESGFLEDMCGHAEK